MKISPVDTFNSNNKKIVRAWNKTNGFGRRFKYLTRNNIAIYLKKIKNIIVSKGKVRTKEYFLNSSLDCYNYLADDTLQIEERLIWWLVHISAMVVAGFVLWTVVTSSLQNPIGTSQVPEGAPLSKIPFPGLALCPLNRLSKKRVVEFARSLIAKGRSTSSEASLVHLLGYLGYALYNVEPPEEIFDKLHDLLEPYNLRDLFKDLTPQCDETLVRCSWRNELRNCSSLFKLRKTSRGFCCTFNYIRENENDFRNTGPLKTGYSAMYGQEYGLSVVVDPQLEDYMYTRVPSEGTKVMIYHSTDYPDITSGGCFDEVVAPRVEQYISIDATVVSSSPAVQGLHPSVRECMTDGDKGLYDSNSECYLICKVTSIYNACGCVPAYLPLADYNRICNLKDEECIRRWKKSWDNSWAGDDSSDGDENGAPKKNVPCSECVPSCSDIKYSVSRYIVTLQPDAINAQKDSAKLPLERDVVFKDHSVLHVFFTNDNFVLLESDILFSWYDWLSSLGGLCGLILGCSILSIAEVVYFFVFGGPAKPNNVRQLPPRELYWREIREM